MLGRGESRWAAGRFMPAADWLAIAAVASLPWSTSATSILVALWALALIPILDWDGVKREVFTSVGGLPVALVVLGALGMLWADVSLLERWKGFDSFIKLLAIPLLIIQFQRSDRGIYALAAYAISCTAVLAASFAMVYLHDVRLFSSDYAVPVKNVPTQSGEFVTCIFGLLYFAHDCVNRRRWWWFAALAAVIAGMLVNITFIAVGRTAVVIVPVLLVVFAFFRFSARGTILLILAACILFGSVWALSPYLRWRTEAIWTDIVQYDPLTNRTASGERLEFAMQSVRFVAGAPLIGHGTGSISSLFRQSAPNPNVITSNPHNQTLSVAIQLGLLGAAVLWAMWMAHLVAFRTGGLAEWIGLVVVVQNIVGSLFNSHLFDFLQGWVYVFGVGVAGGMAIRARRQSAEASRP